MSQFEHLRIRFEFKRIFSLILPKKLCTNPKEITHYCILIHLCLLIFFSSSHEKQYSSPFQHDSASLKQTVPLLTTAPVSF